VNVDPNTPLQELSIAQRQMIDIAKALSINAKLIVMDEPTSSLTEREVNILMGFMRKFKSQGVSIVFISHKLGEVFEITDQITVLRDGSTIDTMDSTECTEEMLIRMLIGETILEKALRCHDSDRTKSGAACPDSKASSRMLIWWRMG
jgi:inositol transport system ATP-binding protein